MITNTARSRRATGLFARIYLTLVLTVVIGGTIVGVGAFLYADVYGPDWVAASIEHAEVAAHEIAAVLDDRDALEARVAEVERSVDTRVAVYDRRGRRIAGDGRERLDLGRHRRRDLLHGRPVVEQRGRFAAPAVLLGIARPDSERIDAIVAVEPVPRGAYRRRIVAGGVLSLLVVFGVGAWALSRSLTRRLAVLEDGARRIATGEMSHRIAVRGDLVRDEIDQLGLAFNEMAGQLDRMIHGQRTLLANVSHELRTPVARMKVLAEILDERVAGIGRGAADDGDRLLRLRQGIGELTADIAEMEMLIGDLLTSGRLELNTGGAPPIEHEQVLLGELAHKVAFRFDADVHCAADVEVLGDELMLERLLSNLLANARRACPDGTVTVRCERGPKEIRLLVQDQGPGIAEADRDRVFEPFSRLDDARARDRGGVGLGLYLCRQIVRAHGGQIVVEDPPPGERGARLVVVFPVAASAADA